MDEESKNLDLGGLDSLVDIAHEFEIDLDTMVTANYLSTLREIERAEEDEISVIEEQLRSQGQEIVSSLCAYLQDSFDRRRRAARLLALVGLVTRFQHWVSRFLRRAKISGSRVHSSKLVGQLEALNRKFGAGPTPVEFFDEIVTLRDSVIHGDSQAEWQFHGTRKLTEKYTDGFDAVITDDQLKDALQKAIQQVKWYDERCVS